MFGRLTVKHNLKRGDLFLKEPIFVNRIGSDLKSLFSVHQ